MRRFLIWLNAFMRKPTMFDAIDMDRLNELLHPKDYWKDLPRGSFVAFHKPTGQFALYLRTVDGYDPRGWTGGPIYADSRDEVLRRAHQLWTGHCDYHGIKYDLGEVIP